MEDAIPFADQIVAYLEQLPLTALNRFATWNTGFQAGIIVVSFIVTYAVAKPVRRRLKAIAAEKIRDYRLRHIASTLAELTFPIIWVIILWAANAAFVGQGSDADILRAVASLLNAWIVIRLFSGLVPNSFWSKTVAIIAWTLAALSILGLLDTTMTAIDSIGISFGETRITLLLVAKALFIGGLFLWLALSAARILHVYVNSVPNLTPSVRTLITQIARFVFVILAVIIALNTVGIDLTVLAVFSGALGIGIGFGLQKVVANFISGIILLLDRSIKPGDVIEVGGTYGHVMGLGARYTRIATRDGYEYLVPNEHFITEQVINWAYSNTDVRVKAPVGIAYHCDVHQARELIIEACMETDRVLEAPKPVCNLVGFGDSSIDLEARFWIADPQNGVKNVTSQVLLKVWEKFRDQGVEFPFPQRDVNWKGGPPVEVVIRDRPDADTAG